MKVLAETFLIEKQGCSPKEQEDAAWPEERCVYEQTCGRLAVAVADGATESIFAGRWATKLVVAVGKGELSSHNFSKEISQLQEDWHQWLAGLTLPWYAEEKARQGSFAALVALELFVENGSETHEGRWIATAVGDSCVFHVRGEEILKRFPLTLSEEFDSRPYLLSSVCGEGEQRIEKSWSGTWCVGDYFYLMTDALACWFLKHIDAGGSPSDLKGDFGSPDGNGSFCDWVDSLRRQGSIRNDDCTLVRVAMR